MKSLGDIFRGALHHHARGESEGSGEHDREEESSYLLLGQKRRTSEKNEVQPSRQEVLNYLGQLADDYHIPRKVEYAVADAESSLDVDAVGKNYAHDKHGHQKIDKHGNPIIKSTDYGLMQINSSLINKEDLKDAHGKTFRIGTDVERDWRANARAGVALLAPAYQFAEWEQGPGATMEDHAQQAYSQYNSGNKRMRDRYLKERRDGMPQDGADRNFLEKYRRW